MLNVRKVTDVSKQVESKSCFCAWRQCEETVAGIRRKPSPSL